MRTVKVGLEADVAGFIAPLDAADKATTKLDRDVEKLDKDIDKLGRDSVKGGLGVDTLGESAKKTGDEVDGLGKKTSASADETGKFDKRIGELKTSVKDLAAEFNKTGDPSLLKKFRADSSELAGLTKMRKELKGLADDLKGGGSGGVGSLFSGGLTSPASLGGLAAVAPLILAAAGALTTLAAAGAVAGAGIGGAIMGNPDVFQQEWSHAIGAIKKDWVDASQPFVGPTIDAIRTIGPLVASWHIDTMFAKAAAYVQPLVHGVEGFVTGIEHGIDSLVGHAGPVVSVFAADLPKIGDAIGTAFSLIGDNAEGGALALHDLDTAISDFIVGSGAIISAAEAIVGGITDASNATKNWLDSVPGWVSIAILPFGAFKAAMDAVTPDSLKAAEGTDHLGQALTGVALTGAIAADQAKATATQYASLATQLNATTVTADNLAASMETKVFNGLMSLDQATLHWHESLTKLSGSITAGKNAINLNTEAGQKNASAAYAAVSANQALYQANVAAGMSAEDAAGQYSAGTAALEKQLRQAGLTGAQVDTLVGKYRGIPAKISTDIAMNGLTDAINRNTALIAQLNHIDGYQAYASVTVTTDYVANRSSVYSSQVPKFNAQGSIEHAAGGTIVPPRNPGTLIVGEPQTGGEAWIPLRGITQSRAMGLAQTVGNAYGFQVSRSGSGAGTAVRHEFVVTGDAGSLERVAADAFMGLVRTGKVQIRSSQILPN